MAQQTFQPSSLTLQCLRLKIELLIFIKLVLPAHRGHFFVIYLFVASFEIGQGTKGMLEMSLL